MKPRLLKQLKFLEKNGPKSKGCLSNKCMYRYKLLLIMIWESNILLKFLFGKCTTKEENEVNSWLNESKHNQQTLSYLESTVHSYL